jgi:hypothetical protein
MALSIGAIFNTIEKARMTAGADLGCAEFSRRAALNGAAQMRSHPLHPVADSENRDPECKHRSAASQGLVNSRRRRAARQDDSACAKCAQKFVADIVRMYLAVDLRLAHSAGNQLRDLRAKIQNQDSIMRHEVPRTKGVASGTRAL